jgi:hypothetical protein
MSNTDKTRPPWVKAHDQATFLVAEHDHRFGPCDLPLRPARASAGAQVGISCTWETSPTFNHDPANGCGCAMCVAQVERKANARRSRKAARAYTRHGWRDEH